MGIYRLRCLRLRGYRLRCLRLGVMSALGTEGRCYGYSVSMLRVTCVHEDVGQRERLVQGPYWLFSSLVRRTYGVPASLRDRHVSTP